MTDETCGKEAKQSIINFLTSNVRKSDVCNIEPELKKDFILQKRRGKGYKKKPRKRKSKNLTRKQKKALGFYSIPRDGVKYKDILPMHYIWLDYMSRILELNKTLPDYTSKTWETFTQTVFKADFHGSYLHVVRSKCPSYVGKKGICIMDTKNTFKIVSEDNIVTTIPKKESVFEVLLGKVKLTLFGKHLCIRPAERSTKKIKTHLHPDL